MYSDDFLRAIPKTDLHCHLDGSLRLKSLIEMAKERKVELPSYTEEGMNALVYKPEYVSLVEYLKGFMYTGAVMRDEEALERVAYELAWDCFNEGVRYLESRFAPQLHMGYGMTFEQIVAAVDRGFRTAQTEINRTVPEYDPEFEYGIIICAMRCWNEYYSPYYKGVVDALPYATVAERSQLASLEVARATAKMRSETNCQIVGFDLAGAEDGYPADKHAAAFAEVHKSFISRTVHAGEAYGAESIYRALEKLNAERVGHGTNLFDLNKIYGYETDADKNGFIERLANYIADRRITLEVCLTSNMQTLPEIKDIRNHPVKKMLERNMSVTFCTDNRLVSHNNICTELRLAVDSFDFTPKKLLDNIICGFKRSFFYRPYQEKRKYVRKAINMFERTAKEYGVEL
ncbi:MAG: adenosine deaminase family protein [Negativicutes bacterium]|jgi:adenosine deaminase